MSVRKVKVSTGVLMQLLQGKLQSFKSNLPDDARIVDAWANSRNPNDPGTVNLLIESEKFEPIPEGQFIPEITVTLTTIPPELPTEGK